VKKTHTGVAETTVTNDSSCLVAKGMTTHFVQRPSSSRGSPGNLF